MTEEVRGAVREQGVVDASSRAVDRGGRLSQGWSYAKS